MKNNFYCGGCGEPKYKCWCNEECPTCEKTAYQCMADSEDGECPNKIKVPINSLKKD